MGGMIGMGGYPLGWILSPKVGYKSFRVEGRRDDGGKGDKDDDDGGSGGIDRKAVSIFSCILYLLITFREIELMVRDSTVTSESCLSRPL